LKKEAVTDVTQLTSLLSEGNMVNYNVSAHADTVICVFVLGKLSELLKNNFSKTVLRTANSIHNSKNTLTESWENMATEHLEFSGTRR
jgi:hypothetical protein